VWRKKKESGGVTLRNHREHGIRYKQGVKIKNRQGIKIDNIERLGERRRKITIRGARELISRTFGGLCAEGNGVSALSIAAGRGGREGSKECLNDGGRRFS